MCVIIDKFINSYDLQQPQRGQQQTRESLVRGLFARYSEFRIEPSCGITKRVWEFGLRTRGFIGVIGVMVIVFMGDILPLYYEV